MLAFFLIIGGFIEISGQQTCNPEVDGRILDECLQPIAQKLDQLKIVRPKMVDSLLPILSVNREDVDVLCNIYHDILNDEKKVPAKNNSSEILAKNDSNLIENLTKKKGGCSQSLIQVCDRHQTASFALKNLVFVCSARSAFRQQSECITSTLIASNCDTLMKKSINKNECAQAGEFYRCIEPPLHAKCNTTASAVLLRMVTDLGCDVQTFEDPVEDINANTCAPGDDQSVQLCFQPLTNYWNHLMRNDPEVLGSIAFPLFNFKSSELVKMCDIVGLIKHDCTQLSRCTNHTMLQFTNSLLALPCGPQQAQFFLNFECIRNVVRTNPQCVRQMPGLWGPQRNRESCWQAPRFFNCLKDQVLAKCLIEGANLFAQAFKQYGCRAETTSWNGNWVAFPPVDNIDFLPKKVATKVAGAQSPQAGANQPSLAVLAPESFRPESKIVDPQAARLSNVGRIFPAQTTSTPPQPSAGIFALDESPSAPKPQIRSGPTVETLAQFVNSVEVAKTVSSAPAASAAVFDSKLVFPAPKEINQEPPSRLRQENPATAAPNKNVCSKVRKCLEPLYKSWFQVQQRRNLSDLTFPTFHYDKAELIELCDSYAGAFGSCTHDQFQNCLNDELVRLPNAAFGYVCSPQKLTEFMSTFECTSELVRSRPICQRPLSGAKVIGGRTVEVRCSGIKDFFICNRAPISRTCGELALEHFKESIKQFGCKLDQENASTSGTLFENRS